MFDSILYSNKAIKPKTLKRYNTMENSSTFELTFSDIKEIKNFCANLYSEPCYREVIEEVSGGSTDFEVSNVRFITDDVILSVMTEEIFEDDYILGCFNASFIASNSNLPIEMIEACQETEAFEAIGKALNATLSQDEKDSFCESYAALDGYGHHFNDYDFNEEEIIINGILYHVFDNH